MIISVDAMGGDYAPNEIVKGAVRAVSQLNGVELVLVGDKNVIEKELKNIGALGNPKLGIVHAEEAIGMDEHPSDIVRGKKKSSMHVGLRLVKDGEASAFFTAGNSGAAMAVAMVTLGLLEGVSRPAIGTILPASNQSGRFFMLDVGANVDCRPEHLLTFAIMGSAYAKSVLKIENPTVGLLSNGEEEGKGDMLTKATFPLLKDCDSLNFTGNVEAKALYKGEADVVVCDGFAGNIAIKASQSVANYMFKTLKKEIEASFMAKIGALLSKKAVMNVRKKADSTQYGGAPLLGVKGVCVIGHGSSNEIAVANGIRVAKETVMGKMNEAITDDVKDALGNIIHSRAFL